MRKIILYWIMVLLLTNCVSALLTDGNIMWLSFDDADIDGTNTTIIVDDAGHNNGTNRGADTGYGGKIGEAFNWTTNTDYVSLVSGITTGRINFSINTWMNIDDMTTGNGQNTVIGFKTGSSHASTQANGFMSFKIDTGAGASGFDTNAFKQGLNRWEMITLIYNSTHLIVYINGTEVNASTRTGTTSGHADELIGRRVLADADTASTMTGAIDEFGMWNRTLTPTEVTSLWNSGVGQNIYTTAGTPTIALVAPATGNITNKDINFTFSITENDTDSCQLYHNATGTFAGNVTLSGTVIGSHDFGKIGIGNNAGNYLWGVMCLIGATEYWSATNSTFSIDTVVPTITINQTYSDFDANGMINHSHPYNNTLRYWFDIADDNSLYGWNINISAYSAEGVFGANYYSAGNNSLSGKSFVLENRLDIGSFPIGLLALDINVSDKHTKNEISNYAVYERNKEIEFGTAEGNNIWIQAEEDATTNTNKLKDRYEFEFDFKDKLTKDRTFHVISTTDIEYIEDSAYKAHFVISKDGLTGNWVDFEGQPGTPIVTKISENHYAVKFSNLDPKVKFNSIGGLNMVGRRYIIYHGNYTQNHTVGTVGESSTFQLNISTYDLGLNNVTAYLIYNGVNYTANTQSSHSYATSLNYVTVTDTITLPTTAGNYSYYWQVMLLQNNSNQSVSFNTTSQLQRIETFSLDDCTTESTRGLIFTSYLEQFPSDLLNLSSAEFIFSYWIMAKANAKNYSVEKTNANNFSFCISEDMQVDIYLKHTSSSGFTHRYYLYNESLWQNTSKTIRIYNYNTTTDVSDLKVTARYASDYNYFPGVIGHLERYYPAENLWRTVQMDKSGDYGGIFFNIEEEDTDYQMKFYDTNNHLLHTTNTMKFVCTSSVCENVVLLDAYSAAAISENVSISYVFDNVTKLLTVTWTAPGESFVTSLITKEYMNGVTTICNNMTNGTSGTMICDLSAYEGAIFLRINSTVASSGLQTTHFGEWIEVLGAKLYSLIDQEEASFWAFLIALPIIMFGIISPATIMITSVIAIIVLYFLGMLSAINIGILIVIIAIAILIGFKVKT